MNNVKIGSPWVNGNLSLRPKHAVQISIVAYELPSGLPARFCAGLIPVADVVRQLRGLGFKSTVRVIDPTPIASYCNGWPPWQSRFRKVISEFFGSRGITCFFDEAEPPRNGALKLLNSIGAELENSCDQKVSQAIQRIKTSGRRHGGGSGVKNSMLYTAAHPFSWLDMYHPLIWKRAYPKDGNQFINLMSLSEEMFAVARKFLCQRRLDLCTDLNPTDRFMSVCSSPCYIPIDGEPTFTELEIHGADWCLSRYQSLQGTSVKHARALKDFEALIGFLSAESLRR